jgi:hypothetical protein
VVQLQFRKSPRGCLRLHRGHDQMMRGHEKVHHVGRKMRNQGRESHCQTLHVKRRYVCAWCRSKNSRQEFERIQSRRLEILQRFEERLCADIDGQKAEIDG